jgi:MFS family permease
MAKTENKPQGSMALVVAASAAGTAFEWYDFFLFVPLAGIIAKTFAAGLNGTASLVFALAAFAIGFAFRPVGALIFGRIGDRLGRKGAFMITMGMMGTATFCIGLLPGYATAGAWSPILFIALRMIQGIALGGEWGGAAIYIAEHSSAQKRGIMGSWLGGSAAFGLAGALLVVLAVRSVVGEDKFAAWGWRLPFLFSSILLVISIWIRLKLSESPIFSKMRDEGTRSEKPYVESFLQWDGLKRVLIVLFAIMIAQGAVWYTAFFYAQFFLENVVKTDPPLVNLIMIGVVLASAPMYVFFGWLSDKIGRKPVMLFGMILTVVACFPGFRAMTVFANPDLARAVAASPVVVIADPDTCSLQFDPVGKSQFTSGCDIAKNVLTTSGVSYVNQAALPGTPTTVKMGVFSFPSPEGGGLAPADLKALKADTGDRIKAALSNHGYPLKADPAETKPLGLILVLLILSVGATALYGPQAAALVEMFPTKIRYTALSLPYHIGTGWVGGFLPATAYAMVAAKGDIYYGLWYPVVVTTIAIISMFLFLPETKGKELDF